MAWESDTKQVLYEAAEGLARLALLATPSALTIAAKLLGIADAVRHSAGAPRFAAEQKQIDDAFADSSAGLGEATLQEAWQEGLAMSIEQAVTYALDET